MTEAEVECTGPTERLLGRMEDPRVRTATIAVFQALQAAPDIEQAALALGFVEENSESAGVGLADDSERLRDKYFLCSTAWRRTSAARRGLPYRWLPPVLWLLVIDRGILVAPPRRAWVITDAKLIAGVQ